MDLSDLKDVLENLDHRLERVEQILPTFATKEEVREEAERTRRHMDEAMLEARRHFDVVAENMLDKIILVADGHAVLNGNVDSLKHETRGRLANHDLRITRLEVKRPRR